MRSTNRYQIADHDRKSNGHTLIFLVSAYLALAASTALAQTPSIADPGLQDVNELLTTGQYAKAESALKIYITNDNRSATAHYLLAYALLRENQPTSSLSEYTFAARLRRPTATDLKNVALDYVLLSDLPDAIKWLKESIANNDRDPDSWYVLGRTYYEQGGFQNAIDCFKKALALAPESVKAANNLGLAYEALGRKGEAINSYRSALKWQEGADHANEQPFLNLAGVLMHNGQLDEALTLLLKAAIIAPNNSQIHEQLGQLYLQTHQFAKAQAEFEQAVALSPDSAPLHFLLGQTYRQEGLKQKAKEEFDRTKVLNGTHSTPNRN
jgi:tetratricopeptide (TPR) repeat protein